MIQTVDPADVQYGDDGVPVQVERKVTIPDCGCEIRVGKVWPRLDRATAFPMFCSAAHEDLVGRFMAELPGAGQPFDLGRMLLLDGWLYLTVRQLDGAAA